MGKQQGVLSEPIEWRATSRMSEPKVKRAPQMRERDQIDRQVPMFEPRMRERTKMRWLIYGPAVVMMLTWLVLAWVLFAFLWPLDPPMPMRM